MMMKGRFIGYVVLGLYHGWVLADFNKELLTQSNCASAKEYITSFEYLREKLDLVGTEKKARQVASLVSAQCSGAADRFIRVAALLSSVGYLPELSVDLALEFAARSSANTETFQQVFKMSFLKNYLDLDLSSSLELALSLSKLDGRQVLVEDEFSNTVRFCVENDGLGLSKPDCARFAQRIVGYGNGHNSSIFQAFTRAYDFIMSSDGPQQPMFLALQIAEKIVAIGPGAVENYILAYRYAMSERGLALVQSAAMSFAQTMAAQTINAASMNRMPANQKPKNRPQQQ